MKIHHLVFMIASLGLLVIFRDDLRTSRQHGFYRFFAFESLLGLAALNAPVWFDQPLIPRQVVSWLLLAGSLGLAVVSFRALKVAGKPIGSFENTTRLVEVGVYRYVRHPMYTSLMLFGLGVLLKDPSGFAGGLTFGAVLFLYAAARVEERENLTRFGTNYTDYMKKTRRFIPFVW